MSLWKFVCSVLLCKSVRNGTHPLDEIITTKVAGEFLLSQRVFLSLTELTDLTEYFCALFRTHRRPPAYRIHRAFQLKVAVRFCEIGWLNVSVEPCVFCSSVIFCERKIVGYSQWGVFLSQSAQSSLSLLAHVSSTQDSGPSPNPSPAGRGVICEVTPIGLLVWGVWSFFFHEGYFFLSQNSQI